MVCGGRRWKRSEHRQIQARFAVEGHDRGWSAVVATETPGKGKGKGRRGAVSRGVNGESERRSEAGCIEKLCKPTCAQTARH